MIAVVLREPSHALALGEILPDQAVDAFVGAAFPLMVRRREVEAGAGRLLGRRVLVVQPHHTSKLPR